jgi:hypothetical protein
MHVAGERETGSPAPLLSAACPMPAARFGSLCHREAATHPIGIIHLARGSELCQVVARIRWLPLARCARSFPGQSFEQA